MQVFPKGYGKTIPSIRRYHVIAYPLNRFIRFLNFLAVLMSRLL
jgi:hypothetical protein